jgi:hypothetical protein
MRRLLNFKCRGAPGQLVLWQRVLKACQSLGLGLQVSECLLKNLHDPAAASLMLEYWKEDIAELISASQKDEMLQDFSENSVFEALAKCTAWLWERRQKETPSRVVGYVSCCAHTFTEHRTSKCLASTVEDFLQKYGIAKI